MSLRDFLMLLGAWMLAQIIFSTLYLLVVGK